MKRSFLSLIILMVAACSSDRPPDYVLSEEQMICYLVDLHIAESSVQNIRLKNDSAEVVFAVVQKKLLKQHEISDSVFVKSYNYYLKKPEKLQAIYTAVVDSISLKQSLESEME